MTRISHGFHNDHAKLKHLLWSEAGHVFDTDADLNSHKIINLLDPTSAQDAATKAYVDIYRDMINYADSPMIVTGGELSEGTNAGTLKVAALTALLRKTDSTTGELTYVTKGEEDNISIPSADTIYYVVLNYNGGNPTVSLETNIPNKTTSIPIGKVMKDSSNTVHYISGGFRLQDGLRKLHERAKTLREIELQSGCNIGYTGTNNFTMTAGIVYAGINKIELPSFDSTTETFTYLYRDGSGGWTEVSANAIDPSHYDDGSGTLAEVANNRYSCHWVYRHVSDGHVYVLYGRGSYKLAEAETAGEPNKPDHLAAFGCLIGKIIAPKNGGSFTEIQMVTDTFFVGTKVSDHSELSNLVWSKAGHTIDTDVDFNSQKIYLDKTNLPNTFLWEDGTDPVLNFDDGDQLLYDISENQLLFKIGGTTELSLSATELKLDGVDLNVNNKNINNVASIDGGGKAVTFYDPISTKVIQMPFSLWGEETLFFPVNNVLAFADQKYSVTITPAPDTGDASYIFSKRKQTTAVIWNAPAGDCIVEIDFGTKIDLWLAIGFYCPYGRYPDNYRIEYYDNSAWHTLKEVTDSSNTRSTIVWSGAKSGFYKLRITIWGYSNNGYSELRIGSIFGMTSALLNGAGYFLEKTGSDKMFGDLNMNDKSINNVASIDGGGSAIVFHDNIHIGVDGSEAQELHIYGTKSGRYLLLGSATVGFFGVDKGYIRHIGTGDISFQTQNTADERKDRIIIRYGDTPDVEILNANLDLNGNDIKNVASIDGGGSAIYFKDNIALYGDRTLILRSNNISYISIEGGKHELGKRAYITLTGADKTGDPGQIYFVVPNSTKNGNVILMRMYGTIASPYIEVGGDLDLNGNDIKNAVVSTTGTAVEGAIRWDSVNHKLQVYNGSSWETVSSS